MGIKVNGYVESKSKRGNSIKVDGEWYGTFNASDLPAEWKDTVEFEYQKDKTGKYNNIIKGTVRVLGAGSAPVAGPAKVPYSNLGVELGHAANVATEVTNRKSWIDEEIGSPAYYKFWVEQTETVYKIMKGLRARHEAEGKPKPVEVDDEVTVFSGESVKDDPAMPADGASLEDLFLAHYQ